jgi:hypothetical protein
MGSSLNIEQRSRIFDLGSVRYKNVEVLYIFNPLGVVFLREIIATILNCVAV